jgi:hypothetical protein
MSKTSAAWRDKRAEILGRCRGECEFCGAQGRRINVHHRYYEQGKKPHEYPTATLDGLCPRCHGVADELRRRLARATGNLHQGTSLRALGYMDGLALEEGLLSYLSLCDYEYVSGIADVYAVNAEAVYEIAGAAFIVSDSMLRTISGRKHHHGGVDAG